MYNSSGLYSGLSKSYNIFKPNFSSSFSSYLSNNLNSFSKNISSNSISEYAGSTVGNEISNFYDVKSKTSSNISLKDIYNSNSSLSYTIPLDLNSIYSLNKPNYDLSRSSFSHSYDPVIGFLNPLRKKTNFINVQSEILPIVNEIFNNIMNKDLPSDIVITVTSESKLKKIYEQGNSSQKWNHGILGFARRNANLKFVYVLESQLDSMLAVIGHELGHVLSPFLKNNVDEEAKAFAFEFTFIKTIIDYNISNLGSNFTFDYVPAENGIHNIAFNFIKQLVNLGENTLNIFYGLSEEKLSINDTIFSYAL